MTRPVALTLNVGSSSLKFGLFDIEGPPIELGFGIVENIGTALRLKFTCNGTTITRASSERGPADHRSAVSAAFALLHSQVPSAKVVAVGHRVVHGGPAYAAPRIVSDNLLDDLSRFAPFAPLHQPHNIAGIKAAMAEFPDALQVACFDTAFHRNHPKVNDLFALPRAYYERGVRRYGFHGLSYDYVAGELRRIAPQLHAGRVVMAHLGNGASMCAMEGGRSVASTMGFTALDGLPMGTRTGQIDPGIIFYLLREEGMALDEVIELFYSKSGLLGLSDLSHDMRVLEAAGTPEAEEAIDYFVFRIRRELGALAATLGGLDAVVFCGGIGENSRLVRERVCDGMGWIGIGIDPDRNAENATVISPDHSRIQVMVIPTSEELVIARAIKRFREAPNMPEAGGKPLGQAGPDPA